jgi:hypothetical protein
MQIPIIKSIPKHRKLKPPISKFNQIEKAAMHRRI